MCNLSSVLKLTSILTPSLLIASVTCVLQGINENIRNKIFLAFKIFFSKNKCRALQATPTFYVSDQLARFFSEYSVNMDVVENKRGVGESEWLVKCDIPWHKCQNNPQTFQEKTTHIYVVLSSCWYKTSTIPEINRRFCSDPQIILKTLQKL